MTLTLDDRVALETLCYRYDVAFDERDADAYVALFTSDAVWDGPLGRYEGAAALRRLIADAAATSALDGTRHWPHNLVIEGDSAAGAATIGIDNLLAQTGPDGPRLLSLGRSEVRAVRAADGGWLIAARVVRRLPAVPGPSASAP